VPAFPPMSTLFQSVSARSPRRNARGTTRLHPAACARPSVRSGVRWPPPPQRRGSGPTGSATPAVRRLTPAERGVWIDLLALMAAASPVGYLCDNRGTPLADGEIARVTNAGSAEEVGKLIAAIVEKDVASRDRTGRLYNRRMVRDAELKRKRSDAGRLGGKSTALKYFNENDTEKILPQRLVQQHRTRPFPFQK